jgi:hypothetical protein
MKRFSTGERALILMPLLLLGAISGAIRVRENMWPTHPSIVGCWVRPATPVELSQGADIGVTVRSVIPAKPYAFPLLSLSLVAPPSAQNRAMSVFTEDHGQTRGRFDQITQIDKEIGIKWADISGWDEPITVESKLQTSRFLPVQERFELRTDGMKKPDLESVRIANFRLTKASMCFNKAQQKQTLVFEVEKLTEPGKHPKSDPLCVGNWELNLGSVVFPLQAKRTQWCYLDRANYMIWVSAEKSGVWPQRATEIRGLLSFERGWPLEIRLHWPKEMSGCGASELQFSTRLAPLPKP